MDDLLRYGVLGAADRDAQGQWRFQRQISEDDLAASSHRLVAAGKPERCLVLNRELDYDAGQEGLPGVHALRRFRRHHATVAIDDDLLLDHMREDYALGQVRRASRLDLDSQIVVGYSRNVEQRSMERCFAAVLGTSPSTLSIFLSRRHMDLAKLGDSRIPAYFDNILPNSVYQHTFRSRIRQLVFASDVASNILAVLLEDDLKVYQLEHFPVAGDVEFSWHCLHVDDDSFTLPRDATAVALSKTGLMAVQTTDGVIQIWQIVKVLRTQHVLIYLRSIQTATRPETFNKAFWAALRPDLLIFIAGSELCALDTNTGKMNRSEICKRGEAVIAAEKTVGSEVFADIFTVLTTARLQVFQVTDTIMPIVGWAHYRPVESKPGLAILPHGNLQRILVWSKLDGWATIYTLKLLQVGNTTFEPYAVEFCSEDVQTSFCALPFRSVQDVDDLGYFQVFSTTQDGCLLSSMLATDNAMRFKRRRVTIRHGHDLILSEELSDEDVDEDGFLLGSASKKRQSNLSELYAKITSSDSQGNAPATGKLLTAYDLLTEHRISSTSDEVDHAIEVLVQDYTDSGFFTASLEHISAIIGFSLEHHEGESLAAEAIQTSLTSTWTPERLRRRDAQFSRDRVVREAANRICLASVVVGSVPQQDGILDLTSFRKYTQPERKPKNKILEKLLGDWAPSEAPEGYIWRDLCDTNHHEAHNTIGKKDRSHFQVGPIPAFRGTPAQVAGTPVVAQSSPSRPPLLLSQRGPPTPRSHLRRPLDLQPSETQDADAVPASSQPMQGSSQGDAFVMTQAVPGPHGSRADPTKKKKKKRAGF
ncbi:hypothetical protein BCR37DRAFT_102251 [Protomyces lactucae-debilis]|uniref:RRN6 K-rich C-terminal domain-containing protein n=1 Tax=Protomyces lactucae-debilis TaxID=2754530 RepID=A0A1Y2F5A1_PROLT|nr:uncharacterized protein BCR37DRAFT_102251 [Protomyces lactucae-debilis]ORY79062.1 hypothetical protein BCR37DRAFT_102251 [Protomyces lactucae-debilis]